MADESLPELHVTTLSDDQRAMLEFLGNPKIIGSHGTAAYYVRDEAEMVSVPGPWLKPPYVSTFTCPVVMVLDKPRMIHRNGDLREVEPDKVGPVLEEWIKP